MTAPLPGVPDPQVALVLAAAQALLRDGVISADQLLGGTAAAAAGRRYPATVAEAVALVERQLGGTNTARAYLPYLRLLRDGYPRQAPADEKLWSGYAERPLADLVGSELEEFLTWVRRRARLTAYGRATRRESVGRYASPAKAAGHRYDPKGAVYNAVGALRRLYRTAAADNLVPPDCNPAQRLDKPTRSRDSRRHLTSAEREQVLAVIRNGGGDPELDEWIFWFIEATGARREGLVNLDLRGLDAPRGLVALSEKRDKTELVPAPSWLIAGLLAFAASRGSSRPDDPVFRYRKRGSRGGGRLSDRRFDNLFQRIQAALAWADELPLSAHVLRHDAIAAVERLGGKAVAVRFARHSDTDVTGVYTRATLPEVAYWVGVRFGERHPSADAGLLARAPQSWAEAERGRESGLGLHY